jgi:lyso-ornithine lipid O-acyltransferase
MSGYIRLLLRAPLVVLCVLLTLLLMLLATLMGVPKANRNIMCSSFWMGTLIFGLHITTQGQLSDKRPLLLVSNHFSYLDLFAIGSIVPAAFTPKSEIAGWPIIGTLCKMAGCLFIDRRQSQTLHNKKLLEEAKATGDIISLFPEGTTNEGKAILPFKSSFFSLAEGENIAVQPLSVVYTHLNGKPLDVGMLPVVGWYGDAYFFPHMVEFLKQKNAYVTLVFHETVMGNQFASRKALAEYCKQEVEKPFHTLLPNIFSP